jgi:hypothetical protein
VELDVLFQGNQEEDGEGYSHTGGGGGGGGEAEITRTITKEEAEEEKRGDVKLTATHSKCDKEVCQLKHS